MTMTSYRSAPHHRRYSLLMVLLFSIFGLTACTGEHADRALVILSSASPETQGMAMVLSTQMAEQGSEIEVLLCDRAGDLALREYEGVTLRPRDVTPQQMLEGLMARGARVGLCALYLPNSGHVPEDLIDGITVAEPSRIAGLMLSADVRTFAF